MASYGVGAFGVMASLFALIGGGELITLTALSYTFGYAALALFIGYALSFVFLGIFAKRVRIDDVWLDEPRFSVPDFMSKRIGPIAGWFTFLGSFGAFLSVLILQFIALGVVLSPLTGYTHEVILVYSVGLVILYLLIAGFRSVVNTDILQAILMVIILAVIVAAIGANGATEMVQSYTFETMSISLWVSLIVAGLFGGAASADVWQRALAAKSTRTARTGFILGGIALLAYGVLISMIGIEAHSLSGIDSADTAFVSVLTEHLDTKLIPFAALLLLASVMSTIDTQIFLLAGLFERQIFQKSNTHKIISATNRFRFLIVGLAVLASLMSLMFTSIVDVYVWLFSIFTVLSPFIVMAIFLKLSDKAFSISLGTNVILFGWGIYSGWLNLDNLYLIALSGVVIYTVAYLLTHYRHEKI